ncbi:MAG: GNAT family N-acetyltransferase [Fimbriimonas ginsengisoli]|uniref:GNAT family N-acetyltransferase n=1 Tax=Fimbriimonas ginsengisoli TaxID=1005039 RepID=A0A931LW51_FIMGI|nr:GNAT family N-acetyltransferase [Fimbriimonas ginsengisoli]
MQSLVIRPLEEADRPGLLKVWALTYHGGAPWPEEDEPKIFGHSQPFVCERAGEIVGGFGVMSMTATRGPGLMRCGGVLAVAVAPHVRRAGVGAAMMRWALRHYREQGFELASLYAFSERFYRAFGYECCGRRLKFTVETATMPKVESDLEVTAHDADQAELIKPCYEAFCHRHSGMNLRNDFQWERALSPKSHRTLYVAGRPAQGYAIVQHKVDFWEDQHVEEIAWCSRSGYEAILGLIRGIGINKSKVSWYEPSDSPFLAAHFDHGCKIEIERIVMYRILNVPLALQALKPTAEGEFTLEVADAILPENRGPWHVAFSPGAVEVQLTHDAALRMSERCFVQALLGEPSLLDLLNLGLVETADTPAAMAAIRLLTPSSVYCTDFF